MADWYVATDGLDTNAGSLGSPWDLESALVNNTDINPGDTLWLIAGTYVHPNRGASTEGYKVGLQGSSGSPITIRPHDNGHVIIDGGLHSVGTPAPSWLIIRDLEVLVSENLTLPRVSDTNGSTETYAELDRPWGGINLNVGSNIKVVNNVLHDNAQGMGVWVGVTGNSEAYGNIIYSNGWLNPNGAGRGHAIYSQNQLSHHKRLANNIMIENYSASVHIYTEGGFTENYTVEDNISLGSLTETNAEAYHSFFIGGANTGTNTDFVVTGNKVVRGNVKFGQGQPVHDTTVTGNRVILTEGIQFEPGGTNITNSGNFVWKESGFTGNLVASPEAPDSTPSGPDIFIEPNEYDSTRAHIAVFNYFLDSEVSIDFGSFLTSGQDFYLLDPTDFYGSPVYSNTYEGSPLMIPTGGKVFVPFVLIQAEAEQPVSVPPSGFMW